MAVQLNCLISVSKSHRKKNKIKSVEIPFSERPSSEKLHAIKFFLSYFSSYVYIYISYCRAFSDMDNLIVEMITREIIKRSSLVCAWSLSSYQMFKCNSLLLLPQIYIRPSIANSDAQRHTHLVDASLFSFFSCEKRQLGNKKLAQERNKIRHKNIFV